MEKAIYKITNIINGKMYIGETKDPKRRFYEHINSKCNYTSLIHQAIKKYGKENFTFEVIGWFEDWREKEKYYIAYYKTLTPYGYNIHQGGGEPPHYFGEDNPMTKISKETAYKVQEQMLNWNIPRKTIIKENKITYDIFRHINNGDAWRQDDLDYPLRPTEYELNEIKVDKIIDMLQNTTLSQKEIGKKVGWARSAVTMINIGKNHHRDNLSYPIRK